MDMTPEVKVSLENGQPVNVERMPDGGVRFSVPANAGYRVAVIGGGVASRMAVAALMAQAVVAQAVPIHPDRIQPRDGRCADWMRDRIGQVKRR